MRLPDRLTLLQREHGEGCWPWPGVRDKDGYCYASWEGKSTYAHIAAYRALVGPIPAGLTIDHLCRVRQCINPAHMEPVTMRVNILRGTSPSAKNAIKTHCKHGHAFTEENTGAQRSHGQIAGRCCRRCQAHRQAAQRRKNWRPPVPRTPPTHCGNGHALTTDNTFTASDGYTKCRACAAERQRRYRARKSA